jgi:hypothetical protein
MTRRSVGTQRTGWLCRGPASQAMCSTSRPPITRSTRTPPLDFQLNRWLAWMTPQALPDVAAAAARVRGYADFHRRVGARKSVVGAELRVRQGRR